MPFGAPEALRLRPRRLMSRDPFNPVFIKACVGLAVVALTLSACGSTAAPSAKAPASSAIAAAVGQATASVAPTVSVVPSAVPSVAPTTAVAPPIKPEATIAGPDVGRLASDGTMLWVLTGAGQVARLDPATNVLSPLATVDPTHLDGGFAVNQRGLWLNDFDANLVYRVDPVSLKVVAKIASAHNPEGIAVDPNVGPWDGVDAHRAVGRRDGERDDLSRPDVHNTSGTVTKRAVDQVQLVSARRHHNWTLCTRSQ